MSETDEMRAAYAHASAGDPPVFVQRMIEAALAGGALYCGFEWDEEEGGTWECTREPGHEPPHVAEGFTQVCAVHV